MNRWTNKQTHCQTDNVKTTSTPPLAGDDKCPQYLPEPPNNLGYLYLLCRHGNDHRVLRLNVSQQKIIRSLYLLPPLPKIPKLC